MNDKENLQNELKEIRDILTRMDKEIHNNILELSKRIFESQFSMTRDIKEVLNLCLKLDNWELDSHNLSRESLKRHITSINRNQSLWTKTIVGLSLLIFATVLSCVYLVFNDGRLLQLLIQRIQGMGGESTMIVGSPQSVEWYTNKWFLIGMGCVCIFTIYSLSKISTYGLWDSILPASRAKFDKDSLDLQNKLNEVNSDILKARQGAQSRIENLSHLVDINQEQLKDINEGLQDTRNKDLDGALTSLNAKLDAFSQKIDGLEEGTSAQSHVISRMIQEIAGKRNDAIDRKRTPEVGENRTRELIKGTAFFRHELNKGNNLDSKVSKGKDLDSYEVPSSLSSTDDKNEGS